VLAVGLGLALLGAKPRLVLAWRRPGYLGIQSIGERVGDAVMTEKGLLSLLDGSLSPNTTSWAPGGPFLPSAPLSYSLSETGWKMIFTQGRRIGYDMHRSALGEFKAGSDEPFRQVKVDVIGESYLSIDPIKGFILVSGVIVHTGRETHLQMLLRPDFTPFPLPFFLYSDLSRPEQGVLGVPLPKGKTRETVACVPYTPYGPLACGDPLSGQVRWRQDFEFGRWIDSKYVIANRLYQRHWALLDGATGKKIDIDLSPLDAAEPYRWAIGNDTVLFYLGNETICYRLLTDSF
jgi:hypothetical protein